jgi:hypothetical protein
MNTIVKYLFVLIAIQAGFYACKKPDLNAHKPIDNDGSKPGLITNIKIVNNPGAAIITYDVPTDANLQYVLAEYSINNTTVREAKSSRYSDTIVVDGFSKAGQYPVKLYAVSKSEIRSEPVTVTVNPTTPPYRLIAATLTLNTDFGGVNVTFTNPNEDKIAVVIIAKDKNGELSPAETFYTQVKDGSFSVRGFDTTARIFGVYIRDRWNNYSDTLLKTISPYYEKRMEKSKFRQYSLPGDQPAAWGWQMSALWDGIVSQDYGFHTIQGGTPQPQRFTFDMGVVAKLSRFKLLQRIWWSPGIYGHGSPRYWNMWGTATAPNPDGSWNGWTKLMYCESIKPSGKPMGTYTNEDLDHAKGPDGLGEEYVFPLSAPPVRYIRMEIIKNWGNTDFFHAYEITFWGNPQ